MSKPIPTASIQQAVTSLAPQCGPWVYSGEVAEVIGISSAAARSGLRRLVADGQAISHRSLRPIPKIKDLRPKGVPAHTGRMELFRLLAGSDLVPFDEQEPEPGPLDGVTILARPALLSNGNLLLEGADASSYLAAMLTARGQR